MYTITADYYLIVLLWLGTLGVFMIQAWRDPSPVVGLGLAYWFNLAMIHLLGGLIQLLPWHNSPERADTLAGFRLTGFAMVGLLLGNGLLAQLICGRQPEPHEPPGTNALLRHTGGRCIGVGLFASFVLMGVLGAVPSLGAILSGGLPLAVGGLCLLWWYLWKTGRRRLSWLAVLAALSIPVVTTLGQGFLGFGVVALLTLGCFVGAFYRLRSTALLVGLAVFFAGLSLYPAYLKARREIRMAVWGNWALEDRIGVTYAALERNWGWFDPWDESHLEAIELRLNQNALLGASHRYLQAGNEPYANGETVLNAAYALIPRVLWPGKPAWAGSGDLVSRFTGIHFEAYTSVGIGHVMELYVNFGATGILLGFLLIGTAIGVVDRMASRYLLAGNVRRFLLSFVPGQALLLVGGNFAEVTAAAAGSFILCWFVTRSLPESAAADRPAAARKARPSRNGRAPLVPRPVRPVGSPVAGS